jgi:acylglycerol lipase
VSKLDVVELRKSFTDPHELVHTSDNKVLFVRRWNPKVAGDTAILIFHGVTAHSGPYGPLIAEQLSAAGFAVFGLDLRGHGLSDGTRGDYPGRERFIKDLTETVTFLKTKSKKLVALGHSLGALSAIVATNNSPKEIEGLILLSAAKQIKPGAYPKPKLSAIFKSLIAIALLRGTPLIEYRRGGMRGVDDPLFNFKYSARFYSTLYGTGALKVSRMFSSGSLESPNLQLDPDVLQSPLLLGIGDQDELFSVDSTRAFYESIPSSSKEFMVIPGGHHAFFSKNSWVPLIDWLQRNFTSQNISDGQKSV